MQYIFKFTPETVWFVLTAAGTVLAQALQGAPPTDLGVWLTGLAAALIRAILGAVLSLGGARDDAA